MISAGAAGNACTLGHTTGGAVKRPETNASTDRHRANGVVPDGPVHSARLDVPAIGRAASRQTRRQRVCVHPVPAPRASLEARSTAQRNRLLRDYVLRTFLRTVIGSAAGLLHITPKLPRRGFTGFRWPVSKPRHRRPARNACRWPCRSSQPAEFTTCSRVRGILLQWVGVIVPAGSAEAGH